MSIGKWIGGVLGFMAFGPLGALAGIILGSFFEEGANMTGQSFGGGTNYDDEYIRRDPYAGERNSFLFSMLVMASYIIRADGKIMHSEMEYVRQFLRRNFGEIAVSQGEEILLKLFDQAKRMDQENNMGFKNTIRECGTQIAYNLSYEERLQLLAFLAEIAKSDGNVCAAEINALKEVAMAMGMSDREVESMLNLKGRSLDDAYKVLEIEPTATDEEVREAAHLACADEFVDGFPKGYDTWIEQGGSNVSGGQKQRLCIARALLRRPKILILDDSTSAVDTKTDAKIRAGLASYLPNTTKIIIAQRISSVQDADRIIVMEGGRIAQIGNHEELLKTSEIYRETFTSQNKMSAEGTQDADDVSGDANTAADNTDMTATQAQTQEGGEAHE